MLNSLDPYRAWQFNVAQYFVSLIIYVQTVCKGHQPRSRAIIFFSKLSTKFILLINVKMPTIVGILTFMSMINTTSEILKQETSLFVGILVFMSSWNFCAQLSWAWKKFYKLPLAGKEFVWVNMSKQWRIQLACAFSACLPEGVCTLKEEEEIIQIRPVFWRAWSEFTPFVITLLSLTHLVWL